MFVKEKERDRQTDRQPERKTAEGSEDSNRDWTEFEPDKSVSFA